MKKYEYRPFVEAEQLTEERLKESADNRGSYYLYYCTIGAYQCMPGDYLVQHGSGYTSVIPKTTFEADYVEVEE